MVRQSQQVWCLGWVVLCIFLCSDVNSDWIQLKNGVQIHGKILRQTEEEVTLELKRGGVSSFDQRTIGSIHQSKPETRQKLPLRGEVSAEREQSKLLPPKPIHPKPETIRSARRPVPGGTLLLPENAIRIEQPRDEEHRRDSATQRLIDATYQLDREQIFVKVGQEPAIESDEAQTEALRTRIALTSPQKLHALEVQQIAGITTWISESSQEVAGILTRTITGWIRLDSTTAQVIEIEVPEQLFQVNPYRFRVIPRSFRAQGKGRDDRGSIEDRSRGENRRTTSSQLHPIDRSRSGGQPK